MIYSGVSEVTPKMPNAWKAATKRNIFAFSAAKNYSQLQELRDAIYDGERTRSFHEFKTEAAKIVDKYNETYLQAEYDAAKRAGIFAEKWQNIVEDADIFPYLKYKTAGDERVRESHRVLDDIILPVNDPFWNNYYPPNGWNCRCTVEQLMMTDTISSSVLSQDLGKKATTPYWEGNVGQQALFEDTDGIPYFEAMPTKTLEAVRHYGLKPASERINKKGSEEWSTRNNNVHLAFGNGLAKITVTNDAGDIISQIDTANIEVIESFRTGILTDKL